MNQARENRGSSPVRPGRGGMVRAFKDTLPEESSRRLGPKVGAQLLWSEDQFLAQWERVAEAWDDDFDAYRRYVGFPKVVASANTFP